VLGPAGTELISFLAARMMLCFGFVTKAVWITHPCFTAEEHLHSTKAFSHSHSASTASKLGVDRRLGGNSQDSRSERTRTDEKVIPYQQSHSAINCRGVLQGLMLLRNWLGMGQQIVRNCFCISSFSLCLFGLFPRLYLLKCLCLYPRVFSLLPFQFSPTSHGGGGEL